MGKLRACLVVAVSALAACGDDGGNAKIDAAVAVDAKIFMDAAPDAPPMFDLTCIGNRTAPTMANATIALSGTAQVADAAGLAFAVDPIDGGTVKACDTTACNGPADGSDMTDAAGDWAIAAITTGGTPLNDYLELTATGVRTTYVYPGVPFTADQAGIPILGFGPGLINFLDMFASCETSQALIAVAVTDCANMPVTDTQNINITVLQGGNPAPNVNVIDLSTLPMVPPEAAGLFLVCNVPANNTTTVNATYNNMPFLAHDVKTVNNTTTTTLVRPGY